MTKIHSDEALAEWNSLRIMFPNKDLNCQHLQLAVPQANQKFPSPVGRMHDWIDLLGDPRARSCCWKPVNPLSTQSNFLPTVQYVSATLTPSSNKRSQYAQGMLQGMHCSWVKDFSLLVLPFLVAQDQYAIFLSLFLCIQETGEPKNNGCQVELIGCQIHATMWLF